MNENFCQASTGMRCHEFTFKDKRTEEKREQKTLARQTRQQIEPNDDAHENCEITLSKQSGHDISFNWKRKKIIV